MAPETTSTTPERRALWTAVAGFFRWWVSELAALLPPGMRRYWQRREHRLVLDFGADKVVLIECRNGTERELGECSLGTEETAQPEGLTSLLGRVDRGGVEVVIRLPSEQVLSNDLTLPMEAEKNLRTVLGYEMDRQTPFSADQVYFDYQIEERQANLNKLRVRMLVVPRSLLESTVQKVVKWGLRPTVVTGGTAAHTRPCEEPGINLLPVEKRQAVGGWNLLNRMLGLSAVALAIVALILPLQRQQAVIGDLKQQTKALNVEVERVNALRDKLDKVAAESSFLADLKQRSPAAIGVLNELSLVLPDDTWLEVWELKDGKMQIQGFSANPSALIGILENSRLFRNSAFSSPVIKEPGSSRYRFQITAEISGGEAR
jgi:general secretion pathway protein L